MNCLKRADLMLIASLSAVFAGSYLISWAFRHYLRRLLILKPRPLECSHDTLSILGKLEFESIVTDAERCMQSRILLKIVIADSENVCPGLMLHCSWGNLWISKDSGISSWRGFIVVAHRRLLSQLELAWITCFGQQVVIIKGAINSTLIDT